MIQEGAQPDSSKGYELPVCDTDKERRNFEGLKKETWYNLGEIIEGDFGGTTDTDLETDVKESKRGPFAGKSSGYSKINRKRTAKMRPFKTSSPRTKEN